MAMPYLPQAMPQITMQQPQNNIIMVTVQGENGAQMYPVAAGNTVLLADFDAKLFWLKTTESNGLPQPMRKFRFEEITPQPQNAVANAVTREEFDELRKMIAALAAGGAKNESANVSQ